MLLFEHSVSNFLQAQNENLASNFLLQFIDALIYYWQHWQQLFSQARFVRCHFYNYRMYVRKKVATKSGNKLATTFEANLKGRKKSGNKLATTFLLYLDSKSINY